MRLLVDIGNTRTKYTFEQQGELSIIQSERNETINEKWLSSITESVVSIVVASVSEAYIIEVFIAYAQQHNIELHIVNSESKCFGVTSSYQQPTTLGIDRWLTLLAANILYPDENVLIIDAGTATTIDLLDSQGIHLGGWILPGIDILFNSLLSNTTKVLATQEHQANISFGKSTSDGVNNACWAATLGFIEQGIKQANKQVSLDKVLLTGGNAKKIAALLNRQHYIIDELVFIGMQRF
ncbi:MULTISPECIES: type III pantothenate kinase [unclassified Colwellia]|uniref:type III pantothenate kinase n=1 Tax=unclassified Colwellia TaxID=196834 RepID=UPI0015F4955B|nr:MULTISPECIES: type III pantothenate kinase [unclassified Colwellia]MBA6353838.1 type III pantothenate kinase [Colwellia sp. BRX9-1]MBA6356790.1 type III pantothenate kinase [Colwellia sp. BRX8-3]MBA6360403.1 type III pantothenate kinase [Colwellia sp. BRX8-6]MBA6368753.1 type III pantothenate kinase [Colwellia sp. BRX8-5]MBA6374471.1 type III pantothenate kinase [Colwellia sp. BRX8-2]